MKIIPLGAAHPSRKATRGEPRRLDVAKIPEQLDAVAATEWRRLAQEIGSTLSEADRNILTGYAVAFSRWQAAERQIAELGPVVRSPAGQPAENPYNAIAARALRQMVQLGDRLGLNPKARRGRDAT